LSWRLPVATPSTAPEFRDIIEVEEAYITLKKGVWPQQSPGSCCTPGFAAMLELVKGHSIFPHSCRITNLSVAYAQQVGLGES
jgi:hypothetical protein